MKREYQSIVHYKKENRSTVILGISIFVFILGLVSALVEMQIKWIDRCQGWYDRCLGTSAMIIVFFTIWGLACSYKKSQNSIAFAIDSNDQGVWINSGWQSRMIYVPFSMLEIKCSHGMITFKYQKAFFYNKKNKLRMRSLGNESLRVTAVNKDELRNFITRFNQLTSHDKNIKFPQKVTSVLVKYEPILGKGLLFTGLILMLTLICSLGLDSGSSDNSSHDTSSTETRDTEYIKYNNLKFNKVYATKKFNFVINKGYRAKTAQNKQVVIFNVTVSAKDNYDYLDKDDFYITTDKDIISDGADYAHNPINSTFIMIGNKETPVVNQMNDDQNYCNPSFENANKKTMNIVFNLSELKKPNYFIYSAFDLDSEPIDKDDDRPSYILKFDPQKLEVLQ